MIRVGGITTKKNAKGDITHVTIDVRKHGETLPVLKEMGLIEKSQFDIDFENGMTLEEFRQKAHEHVNSLPWKK